MAEPTIAAVRALTTDQVARIEAMYDRAAGTETWYSARVALTGDKALITDVESVPGMTELLDAVPDARQHPAVISSVRWAYLAERFRGELTEAQYACLTAPWSARA